VRTDGSTWTWLRGGLHGHGDGCVAPYGLGNGASRADSMGQTRASHDDSKGWSEGGAWAPWMKRGARRQVEQRFLPRSLRTLDLFDLPRAVLQLQRRRRVEPLEPSVLWFLILPTKMTSWVGKGAH
jgi:hypothetical protein